jgi:hypothetical protein
MRIIFLVICICSFYGGNTFSKTLLKKGSYEVFHPSKVPLEFDHYLKNITKYLDVNVLVKGIVFSSDPCPNCPPKAMCKPCYNNYFRLQTKTKKIIRVNYNSISGNGPAFKEGENIILRLKYLGRNGSGVGNELGFFEYGQEK